MPLPTPVLTASRQENNSVLLEWTGADDSVGIEIARNGQEIAMVGEGVVTYTDNSAPADACEYSIWAMYEDKESNIVNIEAVPVPEPDLLLTWRKVNPATDDVGPELNSGDEVTLPFALAVTGTGVQSMRFSGAVSRTENNAPFAPFGDTSGNFNPANVAPGNMTIRAEAFSAKSLGGTKLADESLTLTVKSATVPDPDPDPDPDPTPDPTPGDAWALIPANVREWVKPPPGWKRLGLDLFDRPIAQGQWGKKGGPEEFPKMTEGPVLWRGTAQADDEGNDSSDRGFYDAPNTCWVENHEMKEHIRFGKPGVIPFKHDPTGKPLVNRPLLVGPGHTPSYSDITRWPAACIDLYAQYPGGFIESFKCAHLFWGSAKINQAGYQEYDCPEFKFGDGLRGNAFFHNSGTVGGQESKKLNTDTTQWHHYRLLFHAKGYKGHPTGYAEAWLDGQLVLRKTTNIGTGECYYAKQTETYLKGQAIAGETGGPPLNAQGPQGIIRTRLFQISVPA